MELFLNLAWLVTSAVLTGVAFARAQKEPSWNKRWAITFAALCLLVTIFPVISMSDDLQQASFVAEEKAQRTLLHEVHGAPAPHLGLIFVVAILFVFQSLFIVWGTGRETSSALLLLNGFRTFVSSRPPPLAIVSFR